MLICRQCKSVSFPGVEGRLCELTKAGLMTVERRDDIGISIRNYKYSHTHVAGTPLLSHPDHFVRSYLYSRTAPRTAPHRTHRTHNRL